MLSKLSIDHESIGLDCSINPLDPSLFVEDAENDYVNVATTDFFYPLVDEPYSQGEIACANVLSDLYAQGCEKCDYMLMLVGQSREIPSEYREKATLLMMRGFADKAREAGTVVTGGQTVLNPWPIIGGVASRVCRKPKSGSPPTDYLESHHIKPGHILVLTKPLGTQIAVNLHQWLRKSSSSLDSVSSLISKSQIEKVYQKSIESMKFLNKNASILMKKHGATGCTDVTGFGILGHAYNLSKSQISAVTLQIDTLPILSNLDQVDLALKHGNLFKLVKGRSSETSGGLLIAFPDLPSAKAFLTDFAKTSTPFPGWIVGKAVSRQSDSDDYAHVTESPSIISIPC